MATKYQVFISSTYEDLRVERDRVTRAVLEMGHIPVGMEMFSAADEEQWRIITRHIDESDYYVVIIAHRYGSITDGISYTRKEYEYAISRGIPVLGFIIEDEAPWPADRIEKAAAGKSKLEDFKKYARTKPVDTWRAADDLYGKCVVALMKTFTAQPREGWVRASTTAGPEIVAEISRLSAENARLRRQAEEATTAANMARGTQIQELTTVLKTKLIKITYRYSSGDRSWQDDAPKISFLKLFSILGPSLQVEYDIERSAGLLAIHMRQDNDRPADIIPINHMTEIYAQFRSLEIVEPSSRRHSVNDKGEYWSLTSLGQELLNHYIRDELLSADVTSAEPGNGGDDDAARSQMEVGKRAPGRSNSGRAATKRAVVKKSGGAEAASNGTTPSTGDRP